MKHANSLLLQTFQKNFANTLKSNSIFALLFLIVFEINTFAQNTYTLGEGTVSSSTLGINPFATINRNSRSQYLYLSQELIDLDAINGNIISFALNIKALGQPTTLKPENITIKMGQTLDVTLGTELVPNLPVYYSSAVENITQTGWYTFVLNTPFEWDGESNIIVEICRSNQNFGTSFEVETTVNNINDYRSIGLYSNEVAISGCSLSGTSPMTVSNRRIRPNAQFTMTLPCSGTPTAGVTVVTPGPYCNGNPFTLSIENGAIESGLYYEWQSSPNGNGLWETIAGANGSTLTTNQTIATYYRRNTTCIESQQTIDALAVLVGGEGCFCTAAVVNDNAIGINNVTLNTINNATSSQNLYSNFTNLTTTVIKGGAYELSVNVTTSGGTNYTRAWIDWNRSGSFETSEAYDLGSVSGGQNVNSGQVANIIVPSTAVLGPVFMRIRTSQTLGETYPAPCGPIANGEGEDYRLIIDENLGFDTPESQTNNLIVYSNQNGLNIKMEQKFIEQVRLFDISGRLLIEENSINDNEVILSTLNFKKQIFIVQVITTEGAILNKKIVL